MKWVGRRAFVLDSVPPLLAGDARQLLMAGNTIAKTHDKVKPPHTTAPPPTTIGLSQALTGMCVLCGWLFAGGGVGLGARGDGPTAGARAGLPRLPAQHRRGQWGSVGPRHATPPP
jgi:hypothetical protein